MNTQFIFRSYRGTRKGRATEKLITYYVLNHLNMIVKHYTSFSNCLFVINNDEHLELMTVEKPVSTESCNSSCRGSRV